MTQYSSTVWPNLIVPQPTSLLVAPDPVPEPTPPIAPTPPIVQDINWQAAPPAPNTTTYVNPLVTAKQIRDQFTQILGIDTQPPTSTQIDNITGQALTAYKEPV